MRGDIQLLCEDVPVTGRLIEHIDIVRVFKDVFHLAGGKQVFDVLRNAGRNAAPLSEAFPDLHGVRGGLFFAQQKVHLVDIVSRTLMGDTVDRDAVPDLILYDQHTDLFQLLAEFFDVIGNDAALDIDVRSVIEHVERAGDVDFQRGSEVLRFLFVLRPQCVIQVLQNRHFLRRGVCKIIAVDHTDAAVDDGLFDRLQAVLPADDQFAQGQNKIRFQRKRVVVLAVIEVQVHRVDEVAGGRGDMDDLPVQTLDQRAVFRFGIADDDVVVRHEEHIADLTLRRERFAAARGAEDQTVGVLQEFAIHHNQIVGKRV